MKRKNTSRRYDPNVVVDMMCLLQTMSIIAKRLMKMLIALDDSMNLKAEDDRNGD